MIEGKVGPGSRAFKDAIAALYPVAYTLKFRAKKGPLAIDYGVMPLEGMWWAEDMSTFTSGDKEQWLWTLMIMQPDLITAPLVEEAIAAVKHKINPSALAQVSLASYDEGRCAQILHKEPFAHEGTTVERCMRLSRLAALARPKSTMKYTLVIFVVRHHRTGKL